MKCLLGVFVLGLSFSASAATFSTLQAKKLYQQSLTGLSSEEYARVGELLLRSRSIVEADKMFQIALQLDEKNVRANFYRAFTSIIVPFQGMGNRAVLFTHRNDGVKTPFGTIKKASTKDADPNKPWSEFWYGGPQQTALDHFEDAREFVRSQLLPVLAKSRDSLLGLIGKTAGINFVVDMDGLSFTPGRDVYYQYCYQQWNTETHTYEYVCNEYEYSNRQGVKTFAVTDQELKGYAMILEYYRLVFDTGSSYSLNHFESISKIFQRQTRGVNCSSERGQRKCLRILRVILEKYPSFGLLDARVSADELRKSAVSLMKTAFRFDLDYPKACESMKSFPLCKAVKNDREFELIEAMSTRQVKVQIGYSERFQPVTLEVNLPAYTLNPVRNLMDTLPSDGNVNRLPDPTLKGLFPAGDFVSKLKAVKYRTPWTLWN